MSPKVFILQNICKNDLYSPVLMRGLEGERRNGEDPTKGIDTFA